MRGMLCLARVSAGPIPEIIGSFDEFIAPHETMISLQAWSKEESALKTYFYLTAKVTNRSFDFHGDSSTAFEVDLADRTITFCMEMAGGSLKYATSAPHRWPWVRNTRCASSTVQATTYMSNGVTAMQRPIDAPSSLLSLICPPFALKRNQTSL